MSKVTDISAKICQLGAAEFQEFCDSFLSRQERYGKILGLGKKTGTAKTTTGNPDTYFRNDAGKYIFVAYTTAQDSIFNKIADDVRKCLDPQKTGIQVADISEIIYCHTSSNLSAGDDQRLHRMCEEQGVQFTIYGVDEIAQQVYAHCPILAKDYLGISIDTNQIMSVEDFVSYYNSCDTAAPIDTIFQNRKEEYDALYNAICDKKAVVVYGPAGVGKTRLTLEVVRDVATKKGATLLCVKSNNLELYDDLAAKTEKPGKYIFFVDDANELSGLNLIMSYVTRENLGYKICVVMTVRDYVRSSVVKTVNSYTSPALIEIKALSDDAIKTFVGANFEIANDQFIDQIIRIAEGNPRVAYMAGRLAKDTQSLSAIHDATQIYEQYYATIIDDRLSKDSKLCLVAGVLSFVNAVVIDKLDGLEDLFRLCDLSKDSFVTYIRELSRMEVVEIHFDKVAAIADQCFANYILYYDFFLKKVIPFSDLLEVGFKNFKSNVIQNMNTLLSLFANDPLYKYFSEEVKITWDRLQHRNDTSLEDYARVFHTFRPEASLVMVSEKIDSLPQKDIGNKIIDFDKGTFQTDSEILDFLSGYEHSMYIGTVIELLMIYIEKSVENAMIGYKWLTDQVVFSADSFRTDYSGEMHVIHELSQYIGRSDIIHQFVLAFVKKALSFEYSAAESARGNAFRIYHIQVRDTEGVRSFRGECWKALQQIASIHVHDDIVKGILRNYASQMRSAEDSSLIEFDYQFIYDTMLILEWGILEKAVISRSLNYGWDKSGIKYEKNPQLFQSGIWKLYEILDNSFVYSGLTYEEYQDNRERTLIQYADKLHSDSIKDFVQNVNQIVFHFSTDKYDIVYGYERILGQLCTDREKAVEVVKVLTSGINGIDIYPGSILRQLFGWLSTDEIWTIISQNEYACKNRWQYTFFEELPNREANEEIYNNLLAFLNSDSDRTITSSPYRRLRFVDKFLSIDQNAYCTVSEIIFQKQSYSKFIVQIYFTLLFYKSIFQPSELKILFAANMELLRSIYFFMMANSNLDDYEGVFLSEFLTIDNKWIEQYADTVADMISKGDNQEYDYHRFQRLWLTDCYIDYYDRLTKKLTEINNRLSWWRMAEAFKVIFSHSSDNEIIPLRQKEWLEHIVMEYANTNRVIPLFGAITELDADLRKTAILKFLSCNSDYNTFSQLQLDPSHWGGSSDEIIPDLQSKVSFLKSLLSEMTAVKYLQHAERVRKRIEFWEEQIRQEELDSLYRKLNVK